MTEDELQDAIIQAAALLGWRVHHDRRSDLARTQGHVGFPDLVMAKDQRVLILELKDEKGRISQDQLAWMLAFGGQTVAQASERTPATDGGAAYPSSIDLWNDRASNVIALLVRPIDLDVILGMLR